MCTELECADFSLPHSAVLGPSSEEVPCSRCLEGPPGAVPADPVELRRREVLCWAAPAVLYRAARPARPSMPQQGEDVVLACARASCPPARVLTCAAAARVVSASYWRPLAHLLPWASASSSLSVDGFVQDDRKLTAAVVAPGVPPFGTVRCLGPPLAFYDQEVELLALPRPRRCGNLTFHPISFGTPLEDVVGCLPEKATDFASLIPGRWDSYVFPMTSYGEAEYKRMYREAKYSISPKKAGWESMRLYEILASGSVPVIAGLDDVPPGALAFLDRDLLRRLAALPGVDTEAMRIDGTWDAAAYKALASRLLRHTQRRLTTKAMARYALVATGKPGAKKVLYLANCGHGDYQCYLSLHGFRSLLGEGLVDFPRLSYMYTPTGLGAMQPLDRGTPCPAGICTTVTGSFATPIIRVVGSRVPIYGGGFSYAYRLHDVAINRSVALLAARLRRRDFDAVVVGSAGFLGDKHGQWEGHARPHLAYLWDLVVKHYSADEIMLIDGRDPPVKGVTFHADVDEKAGLGHYFMREIPEFCEPV